MTKDLTIRQAQKAHPWNTLNGGYGAVPYRRGVLQAEVDASIPHIQGTHCALHATKSVGKLCAVFEAMDHAILDPSFGGAKEYGYSAPTDEQLETIKAMSADLLTAALRFAHLYKFDLATELEKRAREKNGVGFERPINIEAVKRVRERTGAELQTCRDYLEELGGDEDKATEKILKTGLANNHQRSRKIDLDGFDDI